MDPRRLTWNQQKWRFRRLIFLRKWCWWILFSQKLFEHLFFLQVKTGNHWNQSFLTLIIPFAFNLTPPVSRCWSPIKQLSLWPWTYGPSVTSNLTSFLVQLGELSRIRAVSVDFFQLGLTDVTHLTGDTSFRWFRNSAMINHRLRLVVGSPYLHGVYISLQWRSPDFFGIGNWE